jgi:hypothetical protein
MTRRTVNLSYAVGWFACAWIGYNIWQLVHGAGWLDAAFLGGWVWIAVNALLILWRRDRELD